MLSTGKTDKFMINGTRKYGVALIVIICIALAGIIVYGFYSPVSYNRAETAPENKKGDELKLTTATIREETDAYSIAMDYPQFGDATIDAQLKKAVDDAIDAFKNLLAESPPVGIKYSIESEFNSVYISSDIVGAKLIISEYTGGAHPLSIIVGQNFDRSTGKLLLLDDALKLIGLTTGQVSAQASAELRTRLGESFFEEGANTNPENFSSFVVSPDKVTFIFQAYQVAAYSAGPQEVSFPRK